MPQILFVCQTWLPEMNLIVNHSRQQIQTGGVDHFIDNKLWSRVQIGNLGAIERPRRPAKPSSGKHELWRS